MIDYNAYCEIKRLHKDESLTAAQIAGELGLTNQTVEKWVKKERYEERKKRIIPNVDKPQPNRNDLTLKQRDASHQASGSS